MLLRLVALVLFFLSLINYSLWRDERSARKLLEDDIIQNQPDARASLRPEMINSSVAEEIQPAPQSEAIPEMAKIGPEHSPATDAPEAAALSEMAIYGIESRISAIGKFVQLNDEQRERLRQKYTNDAIAKKSGSPSNSESLATIIGEQNSQFYQQQVASAFERSQQQELDRDIFYLSRKLAFTASQEQRMRQLLEEVETAAQQHFQQEKKSPEYGQDPSFRVKLMMQENQFKSEWLAGQLKETLTSDQYQAYLQEEAESSNAELGIWHAP